VPGVEPVDERGDPGGVAAALSAQADGDPGHERDGGGGTVDPVASAARCRLPGTTGIVCPGPGVRQQPARGRPRFCGPARWGSL
jgi:hypothetical protein